MLPLARHIEFSREIARRFNHLYGREPGFADKAREAARATDDFVHEEPWKAVGVAAALGLALGVLIGRR